METKRAIPRHNRRLDRRSGSERQVPESGAVVTAGATVSHRSGEAAVLAMLLLAAITLTLLLPNLSTLPRYIFDEVYHAHTAAHLLTGNSDLFTWYSRSPITGEGYTWNHLLAGLLLIASGIFAFGDTPPRLALPCRLVR